MIFLNRYFAMLVCTIVFLVIIGLNQTGRLKTKYVYQIFTFLVVTAMITEAVAQIIIFGDPWYTKVPLDLCNIAAITVAIGLSTRNKHLSQINFFISLGVYAALLTPDFAGQGKLGYISLYCFYFKHMFILFGLYYYLYQYQVTIKLKHLLQSIVTIGSFAIVAGVYNSIFGTNFMYVSRVPEFDSPLSYIGTGPIYVFNFALIVIVILFIAFSIYHFIFNKLINASTRTPEAM